MGSPSRLRNRLPQPGRHSVFISATLLVDVVAVITGYVLARTIVHSPFFGWNATVLATAAIWPVVFATFGLYQPWRLVQAHLVELQRLLTACVVAALLCVLVIFVARVEVARDFIPVLLGFCIFTMVTGRAVTRFLALTANQ
jgi:hypothetical protein